MKNKLISLALFFALLIAMLSAPAPASADRTEDYLADIEFINALLPYEIDPATADSPITRREAVLMSMSLYLGRYVTFSYNNEFSDVSPDDAEAGKLALAVKNGIVPAAVDGKFVPEGRVAYIDAIRMVFNSLNYGAYVQATGQGDVKYHLLSNEHDVKVSPKAISALTVGEMAHLVAAGAEAPYMVIKTADGNGDVNYDMTQNVTSLKYQHGINTIEGVVSQNEFTSLYERAHLAESGITLKGISLKCKEDVNTRPLLGKKLKAYYLEETNELLYYSEDDMQKSMTLSADDISGYNNYKYSYYDGIKTKTVSIDHGAAIIYNGVALTSEDADLVAAGDIFIPESGMVEILETAGTYDCVKITDYKTYIVSGVDAAGRKIIDKYGLAPLDYENKDKLSIRDAQGNPIDFGYIDTDNVLSVEMSVDSSCANIIVNATAVEGMMNSYSNGVIQVEGESFKASELLKKRIAGYNSANPSDVISATVGRGVAPPKPGEHLVLYLDAFGRVADYKISANSGWKYGYVIEISSDDKLSGMNPELALRLLTQDSKVEELPVAKNVIIDGTKYSRYRDSYDYLIAATPIKYRMNPKNEIKEIDNPATTGADEDVSALKLHGQYIPDIDNYRDFSYNSSVNGLGFRHADYNKTVRMHYFKKGALCFTVPENPADTNEKNYAVSVIETSYEKDAQIGGTAEVYWEDTDEIVDTLLVRKAAVSVSATKDVYIVDKVTQGLNDNGDNVWKFYLMNGGTVKEYTADTSGVYNSGTPLTCGDIIRIGASDKNEINVIERALDWESRTTQFYTNYKDTDVHSDASKNPYFSENVVSGELYLVRGKAIRYKNNVFEVEYTATDGTQQTEYFYMNGRVIVVEKAADGYQLRVGSVSDIVFDPSKAYSSDIVVDVRYAVVRNIIVYK